MTSILVVGGGPAGLAAALLAAEAGHKVCLVEAADRFGGMSASIEVAGQRVDLGSHRLHPSASPAVRALLDRLLGADLQTRFRNGRIGLGGSLLGFPLSPLDLARNLPPRFAAAAVADQLTSPLRRPKADTYAEVVRAGLGPAMLDWFYGPYAHKLWGCPPEALAGEIARRRISVNGVKGVVGKILRPQRTFLYPRLGYGQVIDRLVDAAQEAGVDLRSSSAIEALDIADTHIEADLRGSSSEVFDRVWWTAPMGRLAEVVEGGPDASVLRHRAMLLVYLVLDQPRFTPYDAHYFPDPDVLPARLSEPKNYRDGPDPGDRTVLCAEVAVEGGGSSLEAQPGRAGSRSRDISRLDGLASHRPH